MLTGVTLPEKLYYSLHNPNTPMDTPNASSFHPRAPWHQNLNRGSIMSGCQHGPHLHTPMPLPNLPG